MGKFINRNSKDAKWHEAKSKRDLARLYRSLIPSLRDVGRLCGYAIAVHGSMTRDLDLIAVPWTSKVATPEQLAQRIQRAACGMYEREVRWTPKPHGRIACALIIGEVAYIDLSVVQPLV